jgi:hypothetical protein
MPDAIGLDLESYLQELRDTLLLDVFGFRYPYEAWARDLHVLRDHIVVPRGLLVLVGSALQLPGLLHGYVGSRSATQVVR